MFYRLMRRRYPKGWGQPLTQPRRRSAIIRQTSTHRRQRYNAVYVSELGVHWKYCGRSIRPGAVLDEKEQPPAQCRHCRLRLRSSYLVPDQLKALRIGQGLPVRE
jgi:hypothetical protein